MDKLKEHLNNPRLQTIMGPPVMDGNTAIYIPYMMLGYIINTYQISEEEGWVARINLRHFYPDHDIQLL